MNQQCPRCAAAYSSGSRFCQSCGLPLQASQPTAQAVYQAGAYAGQQAYAPPPQQYYAMPAPPAYPKAPLGERFWASVLDGFISLGLSCLRLFAGGWRCRNRGPAITITIVTTRAARWGCSCWACSCT